MVMLTTPESGCINIRKYKITGLSYGTDNTLDVGFTKNLRDDKF